MHWAEFVTKNNIQGKATASLIFARGDLLINAPYELTIRRAAAALVLRKEGDAVFLQVLRDGRGLKNDPVYGSTLWRDRTGMVFSLDETEGQAIRRDNYREQAS